MISLAYKSFHYFFCVSFQSENQVKVPIMFDYREKANCFIAYITCIPCGASGIGGGGFRDPIFLKYVAQ